MNHRAELDRLVQTMSEAEVYTVLKFVQFLETGHVRPRVVGRRALLNQTKAVLDDLVEIVEILDRPEVELVQVPWPDTAATCEGAVEVPRSQWATTLDGFSQVFHDLACHLWVQTEFGEAHTLARDVPLGQIYLDRKGSERDAVQVALNRSGSTYGDFRFMHRIAEPDKIYVREGEDGELVDVIIESAGKLTVLELSLPRQASPGLRQLSFLALIKEREAP